MKELFLYGLIILVAVILLGIYTGEKMQAKDVLSQLPSYVNNNTIENFGPSVANLGDISSGSSTLYNWSKSGNLATAIRAPETCEEATPEPAAEETCVEPAPVPNSCEEEDNCVEPINTSNYRMCRTCDITVNKDIDKYVLKSSVPPCPNMKNFATKNMVGPNVNMNDYILNKPLFVHEHCQIEIIDGILFACYNKGIHMDLATAKEAVQARLDYQGDILIPCCVDTTGIISTTKEAREFLGKEGSKGVAVAGLLSNSPFTRTIGNFYLKVTKPTTPTRLFKTREQAVEWLKEFRINISLDELQEELELI